MAQGWLAERRPELSPAEVEYIQESQAQQTRKQKERQRRQQWTVLALSAGLVIGTSLGCGIGFARRSRTRRQMRRAPN